MGRKAVGPVCCVMHVKQPRTIIVKEKGLANIKQTHLHKQTCTRDKEARNDTVTKTTVVRKEEEGVMVWEHGGCGVQREKGGGRKLGNNKEVHKVKRKWIDKCNVRSKFVYHKEYFPDLYSSPQTSSLSPQTSSPSPSPQFRVRVRVPIHVGPGPSPSHESSRSSGRILEYKSLSVGLVSDSSPSSIESRVIQVLRYL